VNELFRTLLFLPEQASTFAYDVDRLHYVIISVTLLSSTLVGMTALFFFVRYRRRSEDQLTPRVVPNRTIEVLFVVVPLSFFLLCFAWSYGDFVHMQTPPPDCMDVYVTGKQWMWKFAYPEGPSSISTLRVPSGRPVRLLLTSRDVIHSFFVPSFRVKSDVLPGRYTQLWFQATKPGTYQILCTEYCGLEHSGMLGEVVVLEPAEFDLWLEEQRRGIARRQDSAPSGREPVSPATDLAAQGELVASQLGCLKCHTADGEPHIGPTFLDLYGRRESLAGGGSVVVDEAYLTRSMMDPRADVVHGYDPVMPPYRGKLDPTASAALVEFIKSLRSGRVSPAEAQEATYEPVER
jgi:cytochrome c oxidase subunit II